MTPSEPQTDTTEASPDYGCLVWFAIPFAFFAVVCFLQLSTVPKTWWKTKGWTETPCKVLSAELRSEPHQEGSGSTYEAIATYTYSWQGKTYNSSQVTLYAGDSIGGFHRRNFDELQTVVSDGGAFRCFVNPEEPLDAVLYRRFRPAMAVFPMAFIIPFGTIGFGILWAAYAGRKEAKRLAVAQSIEPNKPWLWRAAWAEGTATPDRHQAIGWTFLALLWNGLAWPITFVALFDPASGRVMGMLIGVPMCMIGIGFLRTSIRQLRDLSAGKTALLHLGAPTGRINGHVCGHIAIENDWAPTDGFLVSLTLYQKAELDGSGDGPTYTRAARRQWHRRVQPTIDTNNQNCVPFCFRIPDGMPASSDDRNIDWQIELNAPRDGREIHVAFDIPVFLVREPDWECSHPDRTTGQRVTLTESLKRCGGVVNDESDTRCEIQFPRGRLADQAYITATFGLVLAAASVFFWFQLWAAGGMIAGAIAFALFSLAVHLARNSGTIVYGADSLVLLNVAGGFGRPINLSRKQVVRVTARICKRSGDYQVLAQTKSGDHTLIKGIKRLADARTIVKSIRTVTQFDHRE